MLRKFVKDIKVVSPELRKHYTKKDDGWHLKLSDREEDVDREEPENEDEEGGPEDGGDDDEESDDEDSTTVKKKVKEFRATNIKQRRKIEKLEAELAKKKELPDEEELEELRAARQRLEEIEEKELQKSGQTDKLVERKVEAIKKKMETDLKKANDRANALEGKLKDRTEKFRALRLETEGIKALSDAGNLRPGAIADALSRFKNTFTLNDDDELVTEEVDDTGNEFEPKSYAKHLLKEAPHLWEAGSGGGAGGGDRKTTEGAGKKKGQTITVKDNQPLEVGGDDLDKIISGELKVEVPAGHSF